MCLVLYIGTHEALRELDTEDLNVEALEDWQSEVVQWFTLPAVRQVGAHTGCSCGFPSVTSEGVVEYYPGMWEVVEDRAADLRSVAALFELLQNVLATSHRVELYAAWQGDEGESPQGTIQLSLDQLNAETFFFIERFMYVIQANDDAA